VNFERVKIWDGPVRITHWALVLLIGFSWWSGKEGGLTLTWHLWSGYAILTLVLFRLVWGFVGSSTARFSSFVRGPGAVAEYLRTLGHRKVSGHAGHNALGGWSVVLLILAIAVQAATGLFANDDIMTEGPLVRHVSKSVSDFLTTVHHYNFWVLLGLAGVHVAAVAFYLLYKSENLVAAMVTGVKIVASPAPVVRLAGWLRALVVFAVAAGAVYLLVNA
jgi:cytochrome b